MHEPKKTVLYICGGMMQGVFSAGIVTHLEEANLYSCISHVYGASSGVYVGAYFLSKQTRLGSSIFYEDLTHDFISVPDFFIGVGQRVWSKFIYKISDENLRDAFNLQYLIDVVSSRKVLDTQVLKEQNIPLYSKLLNLDEKRIEYINVTETEDVLKVLEASAQLLPYTHSSTRINGVRYMEAANIDVIGIDTLRERHPHEKIVVILNSAVKRKLVRHKWKKYIEGKIMSYMFGNDFFEFYRDAESNLEKDIEKIQCDSNIYLVSPPLDNPTLSSTTKPKKLITTYQMGVALGVKVEKFIKGQ